MSDRSVYRSRVTTVRGRARAQLAALRKERLARKRAAPGLDALSGADTGLRGPVAPERAGADGGETPVEKAAADRQEPDAPRAARDPAGTEVPEDETAKPHSPLGARGAPDGNPSGAGSAEAAEPSASADVPLVIAEDASSRPRSDTPDAPGLAPPAEAELCVGERGLKPPGGEGGADTCGTDPGSPEPPVPESDGPGTCPTAEDDDADGIDRGPERPWSHDPAEDDRGTGSSPEAATGSTDPGGSGSGARARGVDIPGGCGRSDLDEIPGVGPGLVWMLECAGVSSLADLARADVADLAERLGSISRLLDLDYLVAHARGRQPADTSGGLPRDGTRFGG